MQHIKKIFILTFSGLICLSFFLSAEVLAEKPIHPGYPFIFDETGKLVRISAKEQEMVIDDTLYRLSSETTYHSHDNIFANIKSFEKNDKVGIIFKNKEKKEVLSVWLLNKAEKSGK